MDDDYRQYDYADSDSNTDFRGKRKPLALDVYNVAVGDRRLCPGLCVGDYEIIFAGL